MLPTGEQLAVRWAGSTPVVSTLPGDRSLISIVTVGSDVYAIPFEAAPYIGSAFDRNLFDVTELAAREGPDGAGRVPVSLTVSGASVSVPGVRITAESGSHATGYLDSQSAAAFGAALRARLRANPGSARTAGTPVAGLTHLALDTPAASTMQPDFPQVTLTVKLTPPAGTLLGADVMLVNTDDSRKYLNYIGIGPGNYDKVSVPKGHYALVGFAITAGPGGTAGTFYVPVVADYAVTANNQSATLDARKATAAASFSTPRPAGLASVGMDIVPTDGVRPTLGGVHFIYPAENDVLVQSVAKPKHGVLAFDIYEYRSATAAGESPADYDLTA
jgi:hypothetical protein